MVFKCPAIHLYLRSVQVLEQRLLAILDLATAPQFPDITPRLLTATHIQRLSRLELARPSPGQGFSTGNSTTCAPSKPILVTGYNPTRNPCFNSCFNPTLHISRSNNAQIGIVHALLLLVCGLVDRAGKG